MAKIPPLVTTRPPKADNIRVTQSLLDERAAWARRLGYPKQKWVAFCEELLKAGLELRLYEARNTVSKYITIFGFGKKFKVRFSDHKPIQRRELNGDCDFFVGRTNLGVTTTEDALNAVARHFSGKA